MWQSKTQTKSGGQGKLFVIRVWLWKKIYTCHECFMTFIPWCIVASWEPLGFNGRSAGAKSICHQVSSLWSVFQTADSMWGWISYKTVPGWCYSAIKKKRLSASWRGSPKIIWQASLIMWLASVEKEQKSEQTKWSHCCYSFLVNCMLTYILVHQCSLEIELIDAASSVWLQRCRKDGSSTWYTEFSV